MQKRYSHKKREIVLDHYGPVCVCCGETERAFLTLDHVFNDGAKHRRELGMNGGAQFYRWVIKEAFPKTFQILCFNCNCAKGHLGKCPHEQQKERSN